MEEWEVKLNEEFLKEVQGEGEPIVFSPEEQKRSRESYIKFRKEESGIEKKVREANAWAAKNPSIPLTF